jgi:TPR repeat protein
VSAIRHGDCDKAIKAVNASMSNKDAQVDFVAGRMVDEGVCVKQDGTAAADYYKRSLELGNRASALEYGAKIGLGEGVAQSYEQAGQVCRSGGLDAAGQLSSYSLGYACTVSALASEMMRENLPKGAILPGGGAAMVSFTPADGSMRVRTLPHVGRGDADTGSNVRKPLIDARDQIQKYWQQALAQVPKPDAAKLDTKSIDLPLDIEMTIEVGRDLPRPPGGALLQGDVMHTFQ